MSNESTVTTTGSEATAAPNVQIPGQSTAEATPADVKGLDFAKKFSQLSKKEAQIRAREAEMEAKYKPMNEELSKYKEISQLKQYAKSNPMAVLKHFDLTYDDLVNFQLQGGESNPNVSYKELERKMQEQQAMLEEKLAQQRKSEEETQKSRAVDNYKRNIDSFIRENANDYELINYKGARDVVFQTIEEHYNKHKVELSFKEACDAVEKYFEEEELGKMLSLNKIKARLNPQDKPSSIFTQDSGQVRPPSTLSSNKLSGELKTSPENLSREDRFKMAAQILGQKR